MVEGRDAERVGVDPDLNESYANLISFNTQGWTVITPTAPDNRYDAVELVGRVRLNCELFGGR